MYFFVAHYFAKAAYGFKSQSVLDAGCATILTWNALDRNYGGFGANRRSGI
ncbi:hypothetical protein AA0483_0456 [Acetobacter syzygii NRIC 0483]|nr:hypothetical protein AA0483_0456 [Acetobacter syzygii NRIC 0483]